MDKNMENREIKFRLWLMGKKKWVSDGFSIDCIGMYVTDARENIYKIGADVIACQYTGLPDKNKKEIYEGDILCCNDNSIYNDRGIEKFEVIWDKDRACFRLKNNSHKFDFYKTIEVIGNIYENPELLTTPIQ